ncbi:MAG: DNA helicase [Verrucomicrobiae bacterium]|nr:DNA helicase [Verrucomicrobiae bacterium]
MSQSEITVAVSSNFFEAFAKIPQKKQSKVLNFVNKFRTNPELPGIHLEKIQEFKDQNLRSVRIDDTYRGIVLKPKSENVYLLLWVDHHDKAYNWAKNRVCQINPATGGIQIFQSQEEITASADTLPSSKTLFHDIQDSDLLKLGIPEELMPLVRLIHSPDDLMKNAEAFPTDAYEALHWLAEGETLEDIYATLQSVQGDQKIDTENFLEALENPFSKQQFYVPPSEVELHVMLSAPLEKWRVFLHPSQRKIVERSWNGPVRVLGGAGTGKTVVALHRAKWLAEDIFVEENDRILFTTFTRNLAADIQENLKSICASDALGRIEVINLDRWVTRFLKSNGYDFSIDYSERVRELWEKAMALSPDHLHLPQGFYRAEWEQVIQPQEIRTFEKYMLAPRTGRGTRLGRKERKDIWPVFEEYLLLLDEQKLREPADAMADARAILEAQGAVLPYRSVLVDEAQDMGMQAFKLIRSMVKESQNDIFIVGDAHQRIYGQKVVLGQCGINIIGRSRKLRINYRTTDETRRWATSILENVKVDDLDGGTDGLDGYTSLVHGPQPVVTGYLNFDAEISALCQHLLETKKMSGQFRSSCVVLRTNALMEQYEKAIQANGIPTYRLKRSQSEDRNKEGVRIATMHRVKGLEFDHMFLCAINDGIIPNKFEEYNSNEIENDFESNDRFLLYVAATRAKKTVHISFFGNKCKFINN